MAFRIRAFLEYQGRTLQLDDLAGLFVLAGDFIPPTVSLAPNLAVGTSANVRGGGDLVSLKAKNRGWRFGVHVRGTSEAEITAGIRKLHNFIRQATPERPVFFHYRGSNDVPFNPRWGTYGADLRYEIVFGTASATLAYPTGATPNLIQPECIVNLEIKPYAVGIPQLLCFAEGGILEDTIGIPDGGSRGMIVPDPTTNKMTNPIFGNATFNDAWTTGANLVLVENKDREFVTHGKVSAKILAELATLNEFTQSINVGNTNTHILSCYVKKQDSSAVTSADMELTYGGAVTENYDLVGDGWYRVWGVVTGVNAATTTGVIVKQGRTIYLDGFQIEERNELLSPLAHGDMLDVAWSGTAHASTSVRAGCLVKTQQDELKKHPLESAEGSIRVVWKAEHPNTEYPIAPVNRFVFLTDTLDHYCAFVPEFDTFQFSDGTNVIISSAQSWVKGDIIVFHWTWGSFGLKMYFNGVEIATGTAYTPFDSATTPEIKIGSSGTTAAHLLGTFMDFTTYGEAMTAAEVLADRTNVLEQVEDDRRLGPIPWFWTRNGDGHIENCNDGTKLNYGVAGGIPGSAPALTRIRFEPTQVWTEAEDMWLQLLAETEYFDPGENFFSDHSGIAEASACGGAVLEESISGSLGVSRGQDVARWETVNGKDVYALVRLRDDGINMRARINMDFFAVSIPENEYKNLATDTSQRLFILGPLPFLSYEGLAFEYGDPSLDGSVGAEVAFLRTTGTAAANFQLDFIMFIPRPFALLKDRFLLVGRQVIFEDRLATQRLTSTGEFTEVIPVLGDVIEFEPDKINVLSSMMGLDAEIHQVDDDEFDYLDIKVTPRWELI